MSLGPDPEVIRERRSEWSRIAAMAFMCGLFAVGFFKGGQWLWGLILAAATAGFLATTRDTLTLAFGRRHAVLPLASILAARRQRLGHFAVSGFALDEPLPVANLRVTTPAGTGQPPRTTG